MATEPTPQPITDAEVVAAQQVAFDYNKLLSGVVIRKMLEAAQRARATDDINQLAQIVRWQNDYEM